MTEPEEGWARFHPEGTFRSAAYAARLIAQYNNSAQALIDGLRQELAAMERERDNYRLAYFTLRDDLDQILGKRR